MMKKILLLALCLGLCGCATTYYKEDFTQGQFNKDCYECKRDMYGAYKPEIQTNSLYMGLMAEDMFKECMIAKGYTTQKPQQVIPCKGIPWQDAPPNPVEPN